MKSSIFKKLSISFAGLACSFALSFSAMAATPAGTLEGADETSVYGWVWDSDSYSHIIPVEVSIYPAGSSEALKTATVKADHYQDKLQTSIGDGYHGFKYSVDWNQFGQRDLRVTAYAVTETERVFLGELTYNKETKAFSLTTAQSGQTQQSSAGAQAPGTALSQEAPSGNASSASVQGPGGAAASLQGPGQTPPASQTQVSAPAAQTETAAPVASTTAASSSSSGRKPATWETGPGVTPTKKKESQQNSLGMFTTTGYCNCEACCAGNTLTYSGTVPQPNHTVSADINIFPMGTKLKIGDIVYTVEDIGSNVVERKIDIFYATHEEAMAHGTKTEEVFSVK